MLNQLLNELIPLAGDVVIGVITITIINAIRKLLTKPENGTYSINISFSKDGK